MAYLELLISFMEQHPELAKGQFNGPSGKATQKKLWEELSLKLNAEGGGQKTTQKWQKVITCIVEYLI